MKKEEKVAKVMGEYKRGKLKSSSGKKVKSRKQAIAIAMSEAGMAKAIDKGISRAVRGRYVERDRRPN